MAERGRKVRPNWRPILHTAALAELARGRIDHARAIARQAEALPIEAGSALGPLLQHNAMWRKRIETGLQSVAVSD